MGKRSILVWNNEKSQRTILHAPGCALPETSIKQGHNCLTKFYSTFTDFFKESERVHALTSVDNTHQREEWTHHPRGAVATETEDRNSDDEGIVMTPLIYLEDSDNEESLSNPPSAESTPEPGPPSEKTTKEPTSEPDSDALSQPSTPTREDYMGRLAPKYIVRHHKR